jgi:hypothetical protein
MIIEFNPSLPCVIVNSEATAPCGEPATVGYVLPLAPSQQLLPFRVAGMFTLQPICEKHARAMAEATKDRLPVII